MLYISFSGETSVAISEPGTWYVSVCDKAGNFSESSFVVDEVTLESRMVVTPDGVSEEQDAQSTEKLISSNTHTLLCMDENKLSIEQFMPDDGKLISCVDDKGNFFEKSEFASIISRPEMSILLKYTESEHLLHGVRAEGAYLYILWGGHRVRRERADGTQLFGMDIVARSDMYRAR